MKTYCGNTRPYLYAVFADSDEERAVSILETLSENGCALSFREKRAESAISRASLVLLFVSGAVLGDKSVEEQLCTAFNENKRILTLYLENTALTPELDYLVGQTQGIRSGKKDPAQELLASGALNELSVSPQQRQTYKKRMILFLSALAAVVVGAVILFIAGTFSSQRPGALLRELGVSGDLSRVKQLYLYGEELKDTYLQPRPVSSRDADAQMILYGEDVCAYGHLTDITDFASLKNVEELCLSGNSIGSIAPITGLRKLRFLDLTGNHGVDLSGISALKSLELLNLYETDATELSELTALPRLKTLYVSSAYLDTALSLPGRRFEVVAVDRSVYSFEELKNALEDPDVLDITIAASITVPEGESITIGSWTLLGGAGSGDGSEDLSFTNNGTITVFGWWEMGLCTRQNNGTVVVMPGGVYNGGMCGSENRGQFLIEAGGSLRLNRAHTMTVNDGALINRGEIRFRECGMLYVNGGSFVNESSVLYDHLDFGGLSAEQSRVQNTGHFYVAVDEETEFREILFRELENYNHFPN